MRFLAAICVVLIALLSLHWLDGFHLLATFLALVVGVVVWVWWKRRNEPIGPEVESGSDPFEDLTPTFGDRVRDVVLGAIGGGLVIGLIAVVSAAMAATPIYGLFYISILYNCLVVILGILALWIWSLVRSLRRRKWLTAGALLVGAALLILFGTFRNLQYGIGPHPTSQALPDVPEILKQDCQKLVEGQLLFEPFKTMRQGKPYLVFARLTRAPGINIAEGLNSSEFAVVTEKVSCRVAMQLAPEEPAAFTIQEVPTGRRTDQFLEPDKFSQWDWRVTPEKHGTLHLLLYVTPMLYVEGINEPLPKNFGTPPKVITVTPDYLYELKTFVKENWMIISVLLTAVFIPLFLWGRRGIVDWFQKRLTKKDVFYPLPPRKTS